ncbi:ABC transporter ATP-binding protein [Achromobacter aloeverae]|uniref:Nitrate/sulfonate/bicarbonate ABC transporter ATP-binding protein n=1 Tax=Achromobacter aloeverae TaxID=1750518 RepID=A0A4Q1HPF1_9BURK|nr:ABC transporter ATP-binding protein [Achromobacter aloeverae]RXN92403.1 nitrate/sulfonate/bicarbonate ABC transporter ATP-binding protein [Achromobacter aloeverae]
MNAVLLNANDTATASAPTAGSPLDASVSTRAEAGRADAVRVRHLNKHFGDLEVLRDISFGVGRGEIVALLGASGCGKSTLLNIVSGLESADNGDLEINGQPAARFRDWRKLGYLFQEDRLLPWRTVRENVALGLEAQNVPRAERQRRAMAALEMVGLAGFAQAWPHQLSGGMRSRAALARSLVIEPDILLMDEPFSKLDPQTRTQMHEELLRIQAMKNATILFVTHDVEEAVVLADRIVLLEPRPGRVREIAKVPLARPRLATDRDVAEQTRLLRLKVSQ